MAALNHISELKPFTSMWKVQAKIIRLWVLRENSRSNILVSQYKNFNFRDWYWEGKLYKAWLFQSSKYYHKARNDRWVRCHSISNCETSFLYVANQMCIMFFFTQRYLFFYKFFVTYLLFAYYLFYINFFFFSIWFFACLIWRVSNVKLWFIQAFWV